jgi:hypothetical protein
MKIGLLNSNIASNNSKVIYHNLSPFNLTYEMTMGERLVNQHPLRGVKPKALGFEKTGSQRLLILSGPPHLTPD